MGVFGNRIPHLYGLGCCLFPILQPLAVYLSAGKLASGSGEDTEIRLDDVGIQVKVGILTIRFRGENGKDRKAAGDGHHFTDPSHGYLLTDRVIGEDKATFYDWLMKSSLRSR